MSIRKMTVLGLYTTIALTIFMIEAALPGLAPVPGMKLGLANIVTLFMISRYPVGEVLLVLLMRILLSSMFAGQAVSFLYSLSGGVLCLLVTALVHRLVGKKYIYLTSLMGAVAHNTGQILAACFILRSPGVFAYLPYLMVSGIVTGLFTGFVCLFADRYFPRGLR